MTDPTSTTTADTTRVALAPTPSNAARLGHAIAILIAASIVWFSAGDHALYPPDEGRYGVVSAGMAERGGWLIPEYRGEPHLTKPVLAYWCQALAIRALGRGELAVRLPSLIATSLLVLVVFGAGRRLTGSRRIALIGAVTYAVMPLPMMVGRLATTDAMLALPWFVALVAGWGAATTGRLAPAALLWFAVAVGLLVKGPLAFVPVGIVMLWLLLGGRRREIRRLRPVLGPLLALGPLATWAAIVLWQHPDAVAIWRHEVLDRATGASDHVEPVWFYAPIFLTGLFLRPRMLEAYRVLKPTGSLYFHIDYREAHYCKVFLLDAIFGRDCFLNEIIWAYDYGGRPKRRWPAKHDTIFLYVKDLKRYTFNQDAVTRIPYMAPGLVGAEKAARGKVPTDVWWHTIVATTSKEKTGYPTQ
ncbi:MAG: glycosyltransferase family 39 protein, partial [Phycisphaerales bacterium]|nr:glycosyltransferase family 39 protein [Phycisphaerales bacterium]